LAKVSKVSKATAAVAGTLVIKASTIPLKTIFDVSKSNSNLPQKKVFSHYSSVSQKYFEYQEKKYYFLGVMGLYCKAFYGRNKLLSPSSNISRQG